MKFGTQTKKNMLSSKIINAEVYEHSQDGRRCHLGKSNVRYKVANYCPVSLKFGTQTKTDMLSSKITKRKCTAKKQFVKIDIV
jgi:hypothetical protein